MSFHVGQKVVAVDDGIGLTGLMPSCGLPVIGAIYTISQVGGLSADRKAVGVNLVELPHDWSCGWRSSRFRPLVEDRKSVSFTIGADPDSDRWDNRKKRKEKV